MKNTTVLESNISNQSSRKETVRISQTWQARGFAINVPQNWCTELLKSLVNLTSFCFLFILQPLYPSAWLSLTYFLPSIAFASHCQHLCDRSNIPIFNTILLAIFLLIQRNIWKNLILQTEKVYWAHSFRAQSQDWLAGLLWPLMR